MEKINELFEKGTTERKRFEEIAKDKNGAFCRACGTFESECATPFGYDSAGKTMCQDCLEKWEGENISREELFEEDLKEELYN